MSKPADIPQDVWDAADDHVFRHATVTSDRLMVARAILAERKRAVAAIHWVFSADGTKTERSMADEAVNKINDPTFVAPVNPITPKHAA